MKKILLVTLVGLSFLSCQKDDCQKADFIGTWKGTENCDGTIKEGVIITITDEGSNDKVLINGSTFDDESAEVDGCDLDGSLLVLGIGIEIKGSLEGTTLNLSRTNSFLGLDSGCEFTLTKQ